MLYILLIYIFIVKIIRLKSDSTLDTKHINLIFYKNKTIRQWLLSLFGVNVSSAGLLVYFNKHWYIYQMRWENKTIQKRLLKNKEYLQKYIILNTDIKNGELIKNEKLILQEKARQLKTLYLRCNCLRSFRKILNTSKLYKYQHEILPCIYLLKIIIKRKWNQKRKKKSI